MRELCKRRQELFMQRVKREKEEKEEKENNIVENKENGKNNNTHKDIEEKANTELIDEIGEEEYNK